MNRREYFGIAMAAVALVVVVAVIIVVTTADVSAVALRVNGAEASQASIDSELSDFAHGRAFAASFAQGGSELKTTKGAINSVAAAQWMAFRVQKALAERILSQRNVAVTDHDVAKAHAALAQQLDTAFGHRRTSGHGVDDVGVGGRAQERVDHRAVGGLEIRRRLVEVVERREFEAGGAQIGDRGMAGGSEEAARRRFERVARRREQEVDARRTEPDDDEHYCCWADGSAETNRRQPVVGQIPTRRTFHVP